MSEVFSLAALFLLLALSEVIFGFTSKPYYIFGFIIVWQFIQLFLLYIEKKQSSKIPNTTDDCLIELEENTLQGRGSETSKREAVEIKEENLTLPSPLNHLENNLIKARDSWQGKQQYQATILQPNLSTNDSHIEIAIQGSRFIEETLETKFGAVGKGLHAKLSSVEEKVSSNIVKKIRWIASVRNKTMHTTSASFEKQDYIQTVRQIADYLESR